MYDHVKPVFWLFSALLLWTFAYFGRKIADTQTDKSYWKWAVMPIIVFTLFYGLRFGRLIDYNLYEVRYHALGVYVDDEYELLFRYICHWGASIGIHYQYFIIFVTFMVIFSYFFLVKDIVYRKAMFYILAVFLYVIVPIEQLVRWYLAASFFIFSIYYFSRNNYLFFSFFALCTCLTHVGYIPLVVLFVAIYFVQFQLIPSKICIFLLIISALFGETQILDVLTPYMNIFSFNEKSIQYVDSFSKLVTEGSRGIGIREFGLSTILRFILSYSFPILFLRKMVKQGVKYWIVNTYCIFIIVDPIFSKVEILDRYAAALMLISVPVVAGMAFSNFFKNFHRFSYLYKSWGILSFVANVYPIFSYLFSRSEWWYMLFIWDANGRDTLPLNYFY